VWFTAWVDAGQPNLDFGAVELNEGEEIPTEKKIKVREESG
jgi:hypothetical protein